MSAASWSTRRVVVTFRDYVKARLDRRYGLVSDIDDLRREVAGEFDVYRKELDRLKKRPSGESSRPGLPDPMAPGDHSIRLEVFRSILEPMKPGRLLDLATGHGMFAGIAHELGWEVTAVDARTERMPMTAGIEWLQSDLRDYEIGDFDVITMLGMFYHLELKDQLEMLKNCAGTMTILDTHIALRAEITEDGYEGRFYTEVPDTPTSSWGNPTSFWPTEESLIRMLHDSGYRFIFKLTPPPMTLDRTWYLCH